MAAAGIAGVTCIKAGAASAIIISVALSRGEWWAALGGGEDIHRAALVADGLSVIELKCICRPKSVMCRRAWWHKEAEM